MKTIRTNHLVYSVEAPCDIYPTATEDLDLVVDLVAEAIWDVSDRNSVDKDYIKSEILAQLEDGEDYTYFIAYDDDYHMEYIKVHFLHLVERA